MPVYAEGRVEHQKRTQTATTLWPFGFVFGVQLGSLEKKTRRDPGHAALVHLFAYWEFLCLGAKFLLWIRYPWKPLMIKCNVTFFFVDFFLYENHIFYIFSIFYAWIFFNRKQLTHECGLRDVSKNVTAALNLLIVGYILSY